MDSTKGAHLPKSDKTEESIGGPMITGEQFAEIRRLSARINEACVRADWNSVVDLADFQLQYLDGISEAELEKEADL